MISKELFCEFLNWLDKRIEDARRLSKALQEYAGQEDGNGFFPNDVDFLLNWFMRLIGDRTALVSWWFHERWAWGEEGVIIEVDGKEFKILDAETLYDAFLLIYKEEK